MKGMRHFAVTIMALLAGIVTAVAAPSAALAETSRLSINGAGATFPQPLYERWIQEYGKVRPDLAFSYQGVGSGQGVKRFLAGTVDFGASDAAMTDAELKQVDPAGGALMIPVTAGMVVLAYNIPGVGKGLTLDRDVYQDIFAGRIRWWDDPRILKSNPGLHLPHMNIVTVVRRDSSGTTFVMTNHLAAVNPWWREQGPGVGKLVDWPGNAMTALGNAGVARRVGITDGSIGYMEYEFAARLGLTVAILQNKAGTAIAPSPGSGQMALASADRIPPDLRLFLPDPPGQNAYPIVSYSWILLREHYRDQAKGEALKSVMTWGLSEGQSIAEEMGYIPLPESMIAKAEEALARVQ